MIKTFILMKEQTLKNENESKLNDNCRKKIKLQ